MSQFLMTGGSGFLGTILLEKLLAQGHRVYSLVRRLPSGALRAWPNLTRVSGADVTKANLNLTSAALDQLAGAQFDACYHLAAILKLGVDRDCRIYLTNVEGTNNVLALCAKLRIPHIYYCSTAFTGGRNPYELSKTIAEYLVREWAAKGNRGYTIYKPSIIMGSGQHFFPGHFSQFTGLLIRTHRRAEIVRRVIQGKLSLPVLEPVFRIKGDPEGHLNLVDVEDVAASLACLTGSGTYWLTHDHPPKIAELLKWIGEFIKVDLRAVPDFSPTPLETRFIQLTEAFQPYLYGQEFPSSIVRARPIDRDIIQELVKNSLY